jgi:hypothetical protein
VRVKGMDNKEFIEIAKEAVVSYYNKGKSKDDAIRTIDEVYIVWLSKTLQNNKALLSTTVSDGMYYEATYNGDKGELYLDAYSKVKNVVIKI